MRSKIERDRAVHASDSANWIAESSWKDQEKVQYKHYVNALPAAIMRNGLGQALAMESAGAKSSDSGSSEGGTAIAHDKLFQHVAAWLVHSEHGVFPNDEPGKVLDAIISGSEQDYLRAQIEAIEWLAWHKKFCAAKIADPQKKGESNDA